ncbi:MAG TPA: pitrilysin family protein [Terriglobales bacterium]|nr:pitrilysin family protein [Terriglobales bacterium]
MKLHIRFVLSLIALVIGIAPATWPQAAASKTAPAKPQPQTASSAAKPWEQIKIPPLPAFTPEQPKRIELPNGMILFLQEDHELPLISGVMRIRGGSRVEPAGKAGLVSLYGQTWRTGGTETQTGDQLDDFLEARAAKVETGGGLDSTSLSWSCLKGDFDEVFKIVLDVLNHPAFRDDKLALAKRQTDTAISRRNDDPGQIAARESAKLVYGANSPYARVPEYYTVGAVTRQDLLAWRQRYVHPNNIILGIVGDFDSSAMEQRLRSAFESWPRGQDADRNPQVPVEPAKPGIYFIEKNDVNQSSVHMVHLGIERKNPDYFAVSVMNEVLGGGFSGRLMSNLRTRLGLAYDVHGGVGAAYDHPGMFQLVMETKSGTTAAAIEGLFGQLDGLEKQPATEVELKRAKDTILNSFIFALDDKEKILGERMTYEYYGYPADFLERFRTGVEKTTADDVARVSRKYVHRDQVRTLVLGNSADFDKQLSTFGEVHKVDISIPEHLPGAPAAEQKPAASNPEGLALAKKVAASLGDPQKLRSVKAIKQNLTSVRKTPQGDIPIEVEQTVEYPDHVYAALKTPMGDIVTLITPAAALMSMGDKQQSMPDEVRVENLRTIKRDLIYVAQHAADPSFTFAADGSEKIGDVVAKIVDVNAAGAPLRWFVDPATGHVLRVQFHTLSQQGPVERVIDYSDWQSGSGLNIAAKRTVTENGDVASEDSIHTLELNPTIDPKLFQPPTPASAQ